MRAFETCVCVRARACVHAWKHANGMHGSMQHAWKHAACMRGCVTLCVCVCIPLFKHASVHLCVIEVGVVGLYWTVALGVH